MDHRLLATAAKLLSPEDVRKLDGGTLGFLEAEARARMFAGLPDGVKQVLEAENRMRQLFAQGSAPYDVLERIAILPGADPQRDSGRTVQRGRWSYHPNGYFVRYFVRHYTQTTIQVYLPEDFQLEKDPSGRILRVRFPTPSRGGFSEPGGLFDGSPDRSTPADTETSTLLVQSKLKEFDPSKDVAIPPGSGQRLGLSSAPSKGMGPASPDLDALDRARRMTGHLDNAADAAGPIHSGITETGAMRLMGALEYWMVIIPDKAFDYLLSQIYDISRKLFNALAGEDPPDFDYKIIASAEKIVVPPLQVQGGTSAARVEAGNKFMEASLDLFAYLRAAMMTFERLGAARQAKDVEWVFRQGGALTHFKRESGTAAIIAADRLDALIAVARSEGVPDIVVSQETVRRFDQYREQLRSIGFGALELHAARTLHLTDHGNRGVQATSTGRQSKTSTR